MPLGELFGEQFEYADAFNRLSLSDTEVGLVCAVMLFNPGKSPSIRFLLNVTHRLYARFNLP